jgi:phosphatidate phosphatase APP1
MASDFLKKKVGEAADAAKGAFKKAEDTAGKVFGAVGEKVGEVLDELKRDKEVIPYPTYGYRKGEDEGTWVLRLRVWVSKARRLPVGDEVVGVFASDMGELDAGDVSRLRSRIKHFVADDDSGENVRVTFDEDPEGRAYALPGSTDANGLIQHDLEISDAKARELLAAQGSAGGWLSFKAAAEGFEGKGRVRLVEPEGLSVISDIDDTIKITEVPAGKRIVLRNTFLRDYSAAPGMAERYRDFGDGVMFHYVSGSPWQLYKLLGSFVGGSGYPEGAFHMKDVRKNLLVSESWHDFKNFAAGDEATLVQKVGQITRIFENLPRREFILVGDSGEKDPEVFSEIRRTFGPRVREIIIRDVVDERNKPGSKRLEGMTVIEAPTVVHGVTQFTD